MIDRLDELEVALERAYGRLVPWDATLAAAFERVFEARPEEFAAPGVAH